jgi:hypothetical protein
VDYREIEAEFPELRTLPTFSAAWYRRWRDLHVARYQPDPGTVRNLTMFIDLAEKAEEAPDAR